MRSTGLGTDLNDVAFKGTVNLFKILGVYERDGRKEVKNCQIFVTFIDRVWQV